MPTFDDTIITMPFGKHKNKDIKDVPDSYLTWMLENCNNIDDLFRKSIKIEIMRRTREGIAVEDDSRNLDGQLFSEVDDGLPF